MKAIFLQCQKTNNSASEGRVVAYNGMCRNYSRPARATPPPPHRSVPGGCSPITAGEIAHLCGGPNRCYPGGRSLLGDVYTCSGGILAMADIQAGLLLFSHFHLEISGVDWSRQSDCSGGSDNCPPPYFGDKGPSIFSPPFSSRTLNSHMTSFTYSFQIFSSISQNLARLNSQKNKITSKGRSMYKK